VVQKAKNPMTVFSNIILMLEILTSQFSYKCQLFLLSLHVKAMWQLLLTVHYNWSSDLLCHVNGNVF
jgi:hypothetical protein